MASNDWLMQFMADICTVPVERPAYTEMTALGAAALAAFQLGWVTPEAWASRETGLQRFEPRMDAGDRDAMVAGWAKAVTKAMS